MNNKEKLYLGVNILLIMVLGFMYYCQNTVKAHRGDIIKIYERCEWGCIDNKLCETVVVCNRCGEILEDNDNFITGGESTMTNPETDKGSWCGENCDRLQYHVEIVYLNSK